MSQIVHINTQSGQNAAQPEAGASKSIAAPSHLVALYYQYTQVKDPEGFMLWHKELGQKLGLTGRILIAKEGINATVEGVPDQVNAYIAEIRAQTYADLKDTPIKTSPGTGEAFPKLKVKVRKEIVALGLTEVESEDIDPNQLTGTHLKPEELKAWYENNEDFVVIDMRNDFEFRSGHFKNSLNPEMEYFRDLPKVLPKLIEKNPEITKKKVITVCTGGVRCEKASGYLLKKGFTDVYQLDGGMHMYMDKFPGKTGEEFEGTLYTFDNRITMDVSGDGTDPRAAERREIIGECQVCKSKTERYDHCAYDMCHRHILVCDDCSKNHIYVWCTPECREVSLKTGTDAMKHEGVGVVIIDGLPYSAALGVKEREE
jgi:UPF0176 protein